MGLLQLSQFRPYQPPSVDFMVKAKGCAALLRPGLGKTVVAHTALQRLGVRRTLVCAPAQVVESGVWSREAAAWDHLSHLYVSELTGTPSRRDLELMMGADIVVCSYDLLIWLTNRIKKGYFDAVVYDELQKMKHPGTRRFKRMRAWAKDVEVTFGLTGSPMGNHWADLWGEMYAVAGAAPLGPTKEQYLDTYFKQIHLGRYSRWELRQDGSADEIRARIRPYAFSISKKLSAKELPEVVPSVRRVKVPDSCRRMEEKLRAELEIELASGRTVLALNNSKLAALIRQFASGAIYTNEERTEWESVHDAKLDALDDIIDEQQGEPLLVFTWFRHAFARIKERHPEAEYLTGKSEQVDRWNRKQIPILIVNPQGGGLGLNLQRGSSSAVWFDLPWARDMFDQGNGRLARIGQPDPYVTAIVLLAGRIDVRIWGALEQKGADEASVIEAVALPAPEALA